MSSYPEHTLLSSQWDYVYKTVQARTFNPLEFDRETTYGTAYGGMVPQLTHRPTDSIFVFDFDTVRESHAVAFTPGKEKPWDNADLLDWSSVTLYVNVWLQNVERERSSPNFWAELDKQRELLGAAESTGDSDNTPFTPEEQVEVAKQLIEVRNLLVHTHQADPAALESRIDYLIDASTRMGRRDWLNIFIGGIFSWALTGLVPPEGVREVLAIASHALGHLFGGGVPQLPMA